MNRKAITETFNRLVDSGSEGFTLDGEGREYRPSQGYAVACEEFATIGEALDDMGDYKYVGYWKDPETGTSHIATVNIFKSSFQAFVTGLARRQKCFYDFATDGVIDISTFEAK